MSSNKPLILYIVVIQIFLLFTQITHCLLRVDSPLNYQLDKSGWRTIDVNPIVGDNEEDFFDQDHNFKSKIKPSIALLTTTSSTTTTTSTTTEKPATNKSKKLIEWDDDDHLINDLNSLRDSSVVRLTPYEYSTDNKPPRGYLKVVNNNITVQSARQNRKSLKNNKYSKLIYHGQIKQNNTMKLVDGIKLYINTHKPVSISRRSSSHRHHWFAPEEAREDSLKASSSWANERDSSKHQGNIQKLLSKENDKNREHARLVQAPSKTITELQSNSDWRPIVTVSRIRRMGKTPTQLSKSNQVPSSTTSTTIAPSTTLKPSLEINKLKAQNDTREEFKWRPVIKTKLEDGTTNIIQPNLKRITSHGKKENVVYGKKTVDSPSHLTSNFEELFDNDEGLVLSRRGQLEETKQREAKSIVATGGTTSTSNPKNFLNNRWTPVETTTIAATTLSLDKSSSEQVVTTMTPPMPANSSYHAESAQKSASDLNYIYSSQPVAGQDWSSIRQASNAYYSNYVAQPSQQQQQPILQPQTVINQPIDNQGTIIDTTSGQTPEMISSDRQQEQLTPSIDAFSMPQTSASFQPAQPPPMRLYGSSSYDAGSSYYTNNPARQQARYIQTTSAPNIVRQEHHHHYYNNNNQQLPNSDRSQPIQQQQTQSVIRELQPLLISQPIIQQVPSTTTTPPPPQIIREIIRETPAQIPIQIQPMQLSRVVLPQPTFASIPIQPNIRDFEPNSAPAFSYAPPAPTAQRIIRQISSSLPSAAIKMQSIPVRLPVPTIQFPVRLAQSNPAPVTRQTGSFVIPPVPKKTTTYLTETQAMPTHTTIMHTTQFTPATRTTVYTTDHQTPPQTMAASTGYKR